jgi:S-DNA-T family DNA segregation ATPase FtsK/SpoIIIE
MVLLVVVYALGVIPRAREMHNNLVRIGLVNHAGEAPAVIELEKLDDRLEKITFESTGLPASDWIEMQGAVASALNMVVLRVTDGADMRQVVVVGTKPMGALPEKIRWNTALMDNSGFLLTIGEAQSGLVYMDLNHTPHWLICSTTGGGKTQLLLLIIEQLLAKQAKITIADWKHGIDYSKRLRSQCDMVTDYTGLLQALASLEQVVQERVKLYETAVGDLQDVTCNNAYVYELLTGKVLEHHVLVIDEASMVLDATGRSKEDKAIISEVTERINGIGRIGRAYGVHLIVATQRPDVASIPGSVKANLDGRICGHMADNTSSIVVLDNANAAKLPAIPGRFILRDGAGVEVTFQAYLLE